VDELKQRLDEILETINSRDLLLEEFDEDIFNALVEKIKILIPMHFVFELNQGGGKIFIMKKKILLVRVE